MIFKDPIKLYLVIIIIFNEFYFDKIIFIFFIYTFHSLT